MKKQIKKILVPLDGSKNSFRGLDEAMVIARNCQAIITGVYVTPLSPPASSEQKAYVKNVLLKNANEFMEKAKTIVHKMESCFLRKYCMGMKVPR
jgi:nucleotide-binding universal stress UspA family protein